MNKLSKIFAGVIIFLFCLSAIANAEEQITITTYYPSPYGSYKELYVSDKVGIGTTSAAAKLHIYNSNADSEVREIIAVANRNAASSGRAVLHLDVPYGAPFYFVGQGGNAGDFYGIPKNVAGISSPWKDMVFATGTTGTASERMRITSVGNVGIGTTNPQAQLHTTGGAILASSSGNVGIGTVSPNADLHIYGWQSKSPNVARTRLKLRDPCYSTDWNFDTRNVSGIGGSQEFLDIYSSLRGVGTGITLGGLGNVGIGTTTPTQKLDVRGDSYFGGNVGIGTQNYGMVALYVMASNVGQTGVVGISWNSNGVFGSTHSGGASGVSGYNLSQTSYYTTATAGVYGEAECGVGVSGKGYWGVYGRAPEVKDGIGVYGKGHWGVYGVGQQGVYGKPLDSDSPFQYAGVFDGRVKIGKGTLKDGWPEGKYCIIVPKTEDCPTNFKRKTRYHVITTQTGKKQGSIGMADGILACLPKWSCDDFKVEDTYGRHCSGDANDCKENDPGWFMIFEYMCCRE